ncbi:MAG: PPC domain-containing protein [Anaerolineae bacterium]|nr:PPC domain-containing protein [Anaerolineae bacterium]
MRAIRLFPVLCLLLWSASVALAQTVTITITPASGAVGSAFTVTVDGLNASTEYSLAFIYAPTGATVFTTSRTASPGGQITLNVNSEASDAPGDYRVEVRAGSQVVAQATFTLTGDDAPETAPLPAAGNARLRVVPGTGDIGATYDILVTGLSAGQTTTLSITLDGDEVYRRTLEADENGGLEVQIFTQEGDAPGEYLATLFNSAGDALAQDTFIVEPPIGREGVIDVTQDGATYQIDITAVKPFADLLVTITPVDSNRAIFERRVRASVDGEAVVIFTPEAGTSAGEYVIAVLEGEAIEVASAPLTLDSTAITLSAGSINIAVTPATAPAGTLRIITAAGLLPGETVRVDVRQGDNVIYTEEKTADVNGLVALSLTTLGSDAPGEYVLSVTRGTEVLGGALLVIEGAAADTVQQPPAQTGSVSVTIEPAGGPIGTVYTIRAEGLAPNETVTIAVLFNGRTVFATERTSDSSGIALLNINSEEGDPAGTYSVNVIRSDTIVASSTFDVGSAAVETPPQTPAGEVTLRIEPPAGERGTVHIITITGLNPNETIVIDALLNGALDFSTERTADVNGVVVLNLAAAESDPTGAYLLQVRRGDTLLAEGTLTVQDSAAQTPPQTDAAVSLTVEPVAGLPGADHTVTVTGLTPGETVTLNVLFDGTSVFRTQRIADGDGVVTLLLTSETTDPTGDYTVTVERGDQVIAEGLLTILGADTVEPPATTEPDSSVAITIDPEAGPVGTSHQVTIRNLQPGETVTLNVLYGGQVDFSTERTADRAGVVTINLIAAESDPTGLYTVQVLRGADVVAEADLLVGDDAPAQTQPPLTTPATGATLVRVEEEFFGSEQLYTFSGEAGQIVIISLSSADFDSFVILRDDVDLELISDDDSGGNLNSRIGPYVLPYSGTYTVVVTSFETRGGSTDVRGRFSLNVATAALETLRYNEPVQAALSPEVTAHYFQFQAAEGDIIQVLVDSQNGVDTTLALKDPGGFDVAFDDDGGPGYDPEINRFIVTQPGTYLLVLSSYDLDDSGSVALVVNRADTRRLEGGAQQLRINSKQTADVVVYEGRAGEQVLLNVSVVGGTPDGATLTASQNGLTLMTYSSLFIPEGTLVGFRLPEDGAVSITVNGFSNLTLELTAQPLD